LSKTGGLGREDCLSQKDARWHVFGEFRSEPVFYQLLVKDFHGLSLFWLLFCRHKKVTRLAGRDPLTKSFV